jgi:hypothetical protein
MCRQRACPARLLWGGAPQMAAPIAVRANSKKVRMWTLVQ